MGSGEKDQKERKKNPCPIFQINRSYSFQICLEHCGKMVVVDADNASGLG
jgi:hypothetical protein